MASRDLFIANQWSEGSGPVLRTHDPATGRVVWEGAAAGEADVSRAVAAARIAFGSWSRAPLEQRIERLRAFAGELRRNRAQLAETICREIGKPLWESNSEVDAMVAKVDISIEMFRGRCAEVTLELSGARGVTRYKPHGVLAVLGPFNMPGHLPNGHIVPALLAGDCVVFKPSELAAATGRLTAQCWHSAGLPAGALNLVQGGRETGRVLFEHKQIDGVLFTGSLAGGRAILRAMCDQPGKTVALEMGGNNPLVVWGAADPDAAALITIQSAFITAGQRCSCARRLIVPEGAQGERFVQCLTRAMGRIRVGPWTDRPEPFMGPVISPQAAARLREAQAALIGRGAKLLAGRSGEPGGNFVAPALLDVSGVADRADEELFGPILQLVRVRDFDAAMTEANHTQYGLSAGLLSDDPRLWEEFSTRIRAGVLSWNRPTTNASSRLPFGGIGLSGNHRPSGAFAVDYCSYPVAMMEAPRLAAAGDAPGLNPAAT